MKRVIRNYKKQSKVQEIIRLHIESNLKLYVIAGIIFLIGILLGVAFIKSISGEQIEEVTSYVNQAIDNINIDNTIYLKELIIENIVIISILWLAGLTIIGIIINYFILCFKGFCIGYTISAISLTLGTWKGILFVLTIMFFQNLLLIPAIIATTVSGMRFFKNIMKNRRKESIILEIIRHTIFSIIMLIIGVLSSFLEIYVSNYILTLSLNFFNG